MSYNKNRFKKQDRILVWGHRGASGYAPENTLPAFQKAVELGADGIELDVQLTKDGELIVMHDEKVNRTTDGKGWVKDFTLEELKALNANKHFPEYGVVQVPTLKEVLELMKPTGRTINIEIKTGEILYQGIEEKVVELVHEMEMEEVVLYSSFNHYTCLKLRELCPDAYIGFLYMDGPIRMAEYTRKYGGDALHPALYNLQYPTALPEAREEGLDINVWTVNEEAYVRMCMDADVNAVITNYPDMALKVLTE